MLARTLMGPSLSGMTPDGMCLGLYSLVDENSGQPAAQRRRGR